MYSRQPQGQKIEILTPGGLAPKFDIRIPLSVDSKVEPHGLYIMAQIVR